MTWDEILNSIITKLAPAKVNNMENVAKVAGKIGQNSKYMAKAKESLGDVAGMIDKDTLTRIARTIRDNEHAQKYYTTGPSELTGMATDVVKGKTVKVTAPTSERYIDSKGRSPYTKGSYDIDKTDDKKKEVNIQSTAVDKASYDPKTGIAAIKFHGSNKWYNYVATPEHWEAFLKSPSKGRWIHDVWTPNNWLPGYHRKRK
jgi:hypothetical protein